MVQADAILGLLLPSADERTQTHARNVVQFLRLLVDDASALRAGAVGLGLDAARGELERQDRRRVQSALADLLRHHLAAVAPSDTFCHSGEPALDHASAWSVLEEFRTDLPWLAVLPAPGERPLDVAARLVESLDRLDPEAADPKLWKARIARFTEGPRAAEAQLRELLAELRGRERAHAADAKLVASIVRSPAATPGRVSSSPGRSSAWGTTGARKRRWSARRPGPARCPPASSVCARIVRNGCPAWQGRRRPSGRGVRASRAFPPRRGIDTRWARRCWVSSWWGRSTRSRRSSSRRPRPCATVCGRGSRSGKAPARFPASASISSR